MRSRSNILRPEGKRNPPMLATRYPWRLRPQGILSPLAMALPRGRAQASDAVLERAARQHRYVCLEADGSQVDDVIIEAANSEDWTFWIDRDGTLVDSGGFNEPWKDDWMLRPGPVTAAVDVKSIAVFAYPDEARTVPWRLPVDLAFCTVDPALHADDKLPYPNIALVMTRRGTRRPASDVEGLARAFLEARQDDPAMPAADAARAIAEGFRRMQEEEREWQQAIRQETAAQGIA